MDANQYSCKHCKKRMNSERVFMRHTCIPMQRAKEILTIEGRRAYQYYKLWLDKQKRGAPSIETFCTSSYYSSFYKFGIWADATGIADIERYIQAMIKNQISPTLWRRNEAYDMFIDFMDKIVTPEQQVILTVEIMQSLTEYRECHISQVFDTFGVGEIIELIHQRRFSPWLLFCSTAFKKWVNNLQPHDREFLFERLDVNAWAFKLEKEPEKVAFFKEIAENLEI